MNQRRPSPLWKLRHRLRVAWRLLCLLLGGQLRLRAARLYLPPDWLGPYPIGPAGREVLHLEAAAPVAWEVHRLLEPLTAGDYDASTAELERWRTEPYHGRGRA